MIESLKQQMLANAIALASNAHKSQLDKAGKPYILHPLAVMRLTGSDDADIMAAAVLHDTVEDTKTTYQDLVEAGMSNRVINIVKLMTKQRGQTQDEYFAGILSSKDAMICKLADLTHNCDLNRLIGITDKDMQRTKKYHEMYVTIKGKLRDL